MKKSTHCFVLEKGKEDFERLNFIDGPLKFILLDSITINMRGLKPGEKVYFTVSTAAGGYIMQALLFKDLTLREKIKYEGIKSVFGRKK